MLLNNHRGKYLIIALIIIVITGGLLMVVSRQNCQENTPCITRWLLAAAFLEIFFLVGFVYFIDKKNAGLIRNISEMVQRMTSGGSNRHVLATSNDDLSNLIRAINNLTDQQTNQITQISDENKQLVMVLDNMADGVIIADQLGRVLLINPAAEKILNRTEAEVIGRTFAEAVRHYKLIELWQISQREDRETVAAVEIGQSYFLQAFVSPFQEKDAQGVLVILQDLTQLRFLQTVRRDFISNISHELRTPLASLQAVVETLQDGALEDEKYAQRFLERAMIEVDTLTHMVEELLELSRIESGEVPLKMASTAVYDLVASPVERLLPQAERNEVQIINEIPKNLPLVMADAERMQRVVTNLLHNAIKFTPEGGSIDINAYLQESQQSNSEIVVSISDSGVGIAAVDLPRVFERFFKSDRARTRGAGGTGLGLAIAKHLVEAHGGRIWVKSKESKGSTFYFSIPTRDNFVNKSFTGS